MFDRIENRTGPQYPQKVTVIEQRAPTDASVRLLKDLEREAQKKILSSIRLESNVFKGVIQMLDDFNNGEFVYLAVFSLNGHTMTVEHRVSRNGFRDENLDRQELVKKVGVEIATHLTANFINALRGE